MSTKFVFSNFQFWVVWRGGGGTRLQPSSPAPVRCALASEQYDLTFALNIKVKLHQLRSPDRYSSVLQRDTFK
jgi:hypothetical protein